jgi:hypothetical protein
VASARRRCRAPCASAFHVLGTRPYHGYAVVFDGNSAAAAPGAATGRAIRAQQPSVKAANPFPALLESFFMDRLLIQYVQQQLLKAPSQMTLPNLNTAFLGAFRDHLEQKRANSDRSRNARLAAIHSFFSLRCIACTGIPRSGATRSRHAQQTLRTPTLMPCLELTGRARCGLVNNDAGGRTIGQ